MSEQKLVESPESVDPYSVSLESIDVAQPLLFQRDAPPILVVTLRATEQWIDHSGTTTTM